MFFSLLLFSKRFLSLQFSKFSSFVEKDLEIFKSNQVLEKSNQKMCKNAKEIKYRDDGVKNRAMM